VVGKPAALSSADERNRSVGEINRRGEGLRRRAPVRVSGSVEETRRSEMGKIGPSPSTYDLVGHRRAEERRNPSSTGSVDRLGGRAQPSASGITSVANYCRRSMLSAMDWPRQLKISSCTPIAAKLRMSPAMSSRSPKNGPAGPVRRWNAGVVK
jgi:hypothetical protein